MVPPKQFVYLTDIPIFRSLNDEHARQLSREALRKRFRRGMMLQIEGQPADYFVVLTRGSAKAVLMRPEGGEILLHFYHPGDFFGEWNIREGSRSPHSILVLQDAEFLFFSAALIARLMKSHANFAIDLFGYQCDRVERLQQRLRDVLYERGDGRILRYFELLAAETGQPDENGTLITERISHQTIGDTCGLARETVTRLMASLQRRGKIKRTAKGWLVP